MKLFARYLIRWQWAVVVALVGVTLVALHDPEYSLLSTKGLVAVRRLTQALAEIPRVAAVHSLTNAQDTPSCA